MVHLARYISAAALVTVSSAIPMVRRDGSAIGSEVPVSAPNGVIMSDLPSSTDSSSIMATAAPPPAMTSSMDSMPPPMASSMAMSSMPPPMASSMAMASMPPMASSSMMDSMMASATVSASMPQMTYGSGSSSWSGSSGYNSCVQQCAASYNMPAMTWTPSSTVSSSSGSSLGNGVTHTIIVAPTQGVLRYIPFATNASVGDTISFVWGAGPHTVTQSSALEVCNKTSAPGAFASGAQNKSFVFNQVINDTKPIWFYCGIPTHCKKGMFGGINIGQPDPTTATSMPLSSVMANLTATNPEMSAMISYTQSKTAGNVMASNWGMNTNCAGMDATAMMETAKNVMYMQTLIAANPTTMSNGTFSVINNMTVPVDMIAMMAAGNTTMSASNSASASAAASSVMPAAASSTSKSNGAGSIASSSVIVGLVAIAVTFFTL